MTTQNLLQGMLKIGLAIVKYHIKKVIGNEALEDIATTLTDVGGEQVVAKLDSIFASKEGQKKLRDAAKAADQYFIEKCKDDDLRGMFTMDYGSLPSVQTAIANLPEAMDDETLREALFKAFRSDAPKSITDGQLEEAVHIYVECLQSALIPVKDFSERIIHNALREIGNDVKDIKADVRFLVEKSRANPSGSSNAKNIELIIEKFSSVTSRSLRKIQSILPGMKEPLLRDEAILVEAQLSKGHSIVLTGDAGTGKSGIAAKIAQNAKGAGKAILLVDAREVGYCQTEKDIKDYLDLFDSIKASIQQVCSAMNCRVVIDQLDNIAGLKSARILSELIQDLVNGIEGLEIMVVCRNKELHEQDLLSQLLLGGLTEIICNEMKDEQVITTLALLGIKNYSNEVVSFGKNLLNLELIGKIHIQQPDFDFSTLTDEVYLWDKYIDIWYAREGRDSGEEMFKYAATLAKFGLNHPDGIIEREMPAPLALRRLLSWEIITLVDGRMYRFRHEKFQDYIYARDAADKLLKPQDILNEIPDHKSRNIFRWVDAIYAFRKSPMRLKFFEEVFNG